MILLKNGVPKQEILAGELIKPKHKRVINKPIEIFRNSQQNGDNEKIIQRQTPSTLSPKQQDQKLQQLVYQEVFRPDFAKQKAPEQQIQSPRKEAPKVGQIQGLEVIAPIKYSQHINMLNEPYTHLKNHPINIIIRQCNFFSHLLMQASHQLTFPGKQPQPFDILQLSQLGKLFNIEIPRNQFLNVNFFKSKAFILQCKEEVQTRLFNALNYSNCNPVLNPQQRKQFTPFKAFIGAGNNAKLMTQVIFRQNRWWWQLSQTVFERKNEEFEYEEDEEADEGKLALMVMNEKSAALEDFKEQNIIWTQWKKGKLVSQLK
ncbi:hypothetical protein FGO68_gene17717 [Halteria grandinella]|uniref:Uncharacterized protein n=1 Tax=Halteria grandinella TaxID=5974 RepID=A0A8J8T9A6_HALGN|nr:hypothetical protein FGO68_gene17717 [Halteria grandinella]